MAANGWNCCAQASPTAKKIASLLNPANRKSKRVAVSHNRKTLTAASRGWPWSTHRPNRVMAACERFSHATLRALLGDEVFELVHGLGL